MTEEYESQTMETLARLRTLADELEALAGDFPSLTWYRGLSESLWNGYCLVLH